MNTLNWQVTSQGTTAQEIIKSLETRGVYVSEYAKDIMSKTDITNGVTYNLVGIRGEELAYAERSTAGIFAEAKRRGYGIPPAEVGALLRKKYSQEELGVPYAVVMHEPIRDSYGDPFVLGLRRDGSGDWLYGWGADPVSQWGSGLLFVFLAPQVAKKPKKK